MLGRLGSKRGWKSMNHHKITTGQERCLRGQIIDDRQPGPILRDFRVLLDFLGSEGITVGGKYNLIPMKFLGDLNERLSRPLHLDMKRPQIRSHPYLQGLNLLLRASGLSRIEGAGTKTRLVLVREMMAQWDRLNLTERYFQLLEAWLRVGRAEMVGERRQIWSSLLLSCLQTWESIPEKGLRFDLEKPRELYLPGLGRDFYQLALMDLFGLCEVEQPAGPVTTWSPAGVMAVPFGDAVFTLIASSHLAWDLREEPADEDEEEETPVLPRFGAWQAAFRPYFPEWLENLEFPEPEQREGEFVFRVSVGKVWRLIAIPADATLDDLVGWILQSVEFDDDHLYEFRYRNRLGAEATAGHPGTDEGPWVDEIRIGTLPLEPGQSMQLRYDFGDDWRFDVRLERIDPPGGKAEGARILGRHGESPEQYPNHWDE